MSSFQPQKLPDRRLRPNLHAPARFVQAESDLRLGTQSQRHAFSLSQRIVCDVVGVLDFVAVLLSAQAVVWLGGFNGVLAADEGKGLLTLSPIVAVVFVLALRATGLYELRTLIQVSRQVSRFLIVWTLMSIVASVSALGLYSDPPFLLAAWLCFAPIVVITLRAGLALGFRALLDHGPLARRVALVGSDPHLVRAAGIVNEDRLCRLAGVFELPDPGMETAIDRVVFAIRNSRFDDVIVLVPNLAETGLERLVQTLSTLPLRVSLLPVAGLFGLDEAGPGIAQAVSVTVSDKPVRGWSIGLKAFVDVVGAITLLLVTSPLMLAIAVAIKLDSEGPVIFRQHRSGRGGRIFTLYKFRSMDVCEDGPHIRQAERNDPRVTRVGRIIRKFSMDELPQLVNVLRGEMSLIGPRPHAVAHDYHYGALVPRYWERFRVKPGITGWAQVNGHRGETKTINDMAERIQFDIEYSDDYSIWRDLWIIVLTPWTLIMRQDKAY